VIRAHTNMYHGLMERLRWWLVSQVAAANPGFRTNELSDEDMGEALRYVVSHETAHSVGLPHNQRANFVFPVDSIRNPDFVRRMGHSASSVGRTRYNYAAQPGDGVPPERRIGLWDKFAVMWGYRPIPEARPRGRELPTLNRWIVERADQPWFRFGGGAVRDGRGVGPVPDDRGHLLRPGRGRGATACATCAPPPDSLMQWVLRPGDDYYELETHYLQNLTQWNRYAEHAAAAVGGSWTHHKRFGEEGPVYTAVEPAYQRRRCGSSTSTCCRRRTGRSMPVCCGGSSTRAPSSGSARTRSWPCSGC
jgi:hypothetical protein